MNDHEPRDRLSSLYVSLLRLTWLHMVLRMLLIQRWVLNTCRYVIFGIDTQPVPRPTQKELRDMYG